jgi:hypothetical protein
VFAWIWNVQISCPGGDRYEREAGTLAVLYGELLGMSRYRDDGTEVGYGYIKIARPDGKLPQIGFESDDSGSEPAPRWPDPEYPQQMHLDITVADLDAAEAVAVSNGATRLADCGDHRVFADTVGHPFCLYAADEASAHGSAQGRIARIVFECFSPRALAEFYQDLLDMRRRVVDTPRRVVISGEPRRLQITDDAGNSRDLPPDPHAPTLAFQHAQFPAARWPDPRHPAQMHLDLGFDERDAALARMEHLGAIRLSDSVYADPAAHPYCV